MLTETADMEVARRAPGRLGILLELGKVRISSLATISMITGYILARGGVTFDLLLMTIGVFLIASGSATINHIQDRDVDSRMQRTMGRPIPSGRISVGRAWLVALAAITAGGCLIFIASNWLAVVLGLLAVSWYNAVYTPLKRVTAFAAVPGGVVGAIPPIMGWVAGGGSALDPRILAVAFFFFVWQVPHFWLLLLFTCGKDYEKAGMPSLTDIFSMNQIARITFVWILAAVVTCLILPLYGIVTNPWISAGLVAASVRLVWQSIAILRGPLRTPGFRVAFKQINMYVVAVIMLLSLNGVIG